MGAEGTTTMAKKASAPKKTKAPLDHPPYVEMIKSALLALKERTGSSHYAIAKHIEEQQKVTLPPNFRKLLSVQLKKLVASGRLMKVKNSFKLPPTAVRKPSTATESKPKPKPADVKSKAPKATSVKAKAKAFVKPKAKAADKVKKVKATAKPVKAAKSATVKSPARKVTAVKVKKAVEKAKKPRSIKSPAKKAQAAKKAKK